MGKTVRDVLDELRSNSHDEVEKGRKFEHLMLAFLRNDLQYSKLFDQVWLWGDYPNRGNRPDTGIDLVARETATGDLVAIQCKFYAPDTVISKPAVDSFLATSSKAEFSGRLFITTSDYWGKNAKDALMNQTPPVSIMSVADLDESSIDWSKLSTKNLAELSVEPIKQPRSHQESAIEDCLKGFKESARGRLIMACGTGKTFTSLRLTEKLLPKGGLVLFLVPSISLLSQAVKEWSINSEANITSFAVCSDATAGKRKSSEDLPVTDLAFPATTNTESFMEKYRNSKRTKDSLQVVFSTYQSIAVVSEAQALGLPNFDLIICDEAHRTTGVTASGSEASTFMKVHDEDFISGSKRLYMTATPKVFSDAATQKAEEAEAIIADMNNESIFGPEFHRLGFGEAVERDILTDYKVLVLAVDEQYIAEKFQQELASEDGQLNLEDTAKIVGCWNGLSKRALNRTDFSTDPEPMKRAVAFARSIAESKSVAAMFQQVVDKEISLRSDGLELRCEVQHVDGTFSSFDRNEKLDWLKQDPGPGTARILSNARCLTEGVDVPALDAIMFLKPRESQIDVVQAVGRVMRKLEGKKYGYVILPIAIPAGVDPESALSDNKKYKTVWQVLQALRSHDERFDAMVHRIDLTGKSPQIEIVGVGAGEPESSVNWTQGELAFPNFDNWKEAILAKIVERVGERKYWERWAEDIAGVARRQISRIERLVTDDNSKQLAFNRFLKGLQDNLNPSIDAKEAVEMLAQHQITKPIFDALFGDYEFTKLNPVSVVMDSMLVSLSDSKLESETAELADFYKSVEMRVGGLTDDSARQHVIKQLYEQFFKTAFPGTAERLGIVYTPNEIVDFIIASVESILKSDFKSSISDPNVHLLDPFTGTGTFVVRLLQSSLLSEDALVEKYKHGLHANELVLLAYYIAAINIESTFHSKTGLNYEPFGGLVLTDSFQLYEDGDQLDSQGIFSNNNSRAEAQLALDIRVVFGNPPYSKGQESMNDDNKNLIYPSLDSRVAETFVKRSNAQNKNALYDSYIRSMRWASDRIGDSGIVAFVSNGSFIDGSSSDGIRRTLLEEFDKIYVLNLRGNQRTAGEESRREGGKVFGSGSRSTVAIYFLVKSKTSKPKNGELFYCDIGEYLSREQKLEKVAAWSDVSSVPWDRPTPDDNGDWINQRDSRYGSYLALGSKRGSERLTVFNNFSLGVKTARDAWVNNVSEVSVRENMKRMLEHFNAQVDLAQSAKASGELWSRDNDPRKISWNYADTKRLESGKKLSTKDFSVVPCMYRPFMETRLAFGAKVNDAVYQLPKMFSETASTRSIAVTGVGAAVPFTAFMVNMIPDLSIFGSQSNTQVFPESMLAAQGNSEELGLFASLNNDNLQDSMNLSQGTMKSVEKALGREINSTEWFDYVYAVLNWPAYKTKYSIDLRKELPRIPIVKQFSKMSELGARLSELHLNYDSLAEYPLEVQGSLSDGIRVSKMRYGGTSVNQDKSVVYLTPKIAVKGIPLEAHQFTMGTKSPIDWVVDRYGISVDKSSGIVNDSNSIALRKSDPEYPIKLIARLVTLSIETSKVLKEMPSSIDIVAI